MRTFICTSNTGKLNEFKQALQASNNICGLNDLSSFAEYEYYEPKENSDYFISNASIKLFSALKFIVKNFNTHECFSKVSKIIVDDSGLCVPDLNYLPGVHSANFSGYPKEENKNNILLREKILEYQNPILYKEEKRLKAFFVCFLLSINIHNIREFEFIKNIEFLEADKLLKRKLLSDGNIVMLENKLLKKVDLNSPGGAFHERVQSFLLCEEFPSNIIVDICYGFCSGQVSTQIQNNIPGMGHGYDPMFYPALDPDLSFASIPLSEKNNISHRAYAMKAFLGSSI